MVQWATDWQIKPWEYLGLRREDIDSRHYRAWILASIEVHYADLEKARKKAQKK